MAGVTVAVAVQAALVVATVDWTQVIIYGIPSCLSAIVSAYVAIVATANRRNIATGNGMSIGHMVEETHGFTRALPTPSGDPIGHVAERSEHLASANVALTKQVHEAVLGEKQENDSA